MNKKLNLLLAAFSLVMVSQCKAVFIENEFGGIVLEASLPGVEIYYEFTGRLKVDIGNLQIVSLGVIARKGGLIQNLVGKVPIHGGSSEFATSIGSQNPHLLSISEVLTKVPTATIRIVADPENQKRPKIILPTLEQLKEQLKKEGATAPAQAESKESAEVALLKAELAKAKKALGDIKTLAAAY